MRVLVANRGEIACRILRTLREMSVASVAVYTAADAAAPHLDLADEAVELKSERGYLDGEELLRAARAQDADAVHPGYGFLSQSALFARACGAAGVTFIGPSPEAMIALGDKRGSRKTAEDLGVPVVPGAHECDTLEAVDAAAGRIGFPLLLKAAGGGGGKGMRLVHQRAQLRESFEAARREAESAFADARLLVEKFIAPARHVEVQILGDGRDAVALGERECSLQRRYQKVLEEAPSPGINPRTRAGLLDSAARLARAVGYAGAATVEFLVGPDGAHYFLEVNARLQVEHPVTELLTGIDLVRAQVEIACGGRLPDPPTPRGHAIEVRVNAEDPYRDFLPQTGTVEMLEFPHRPGLRVDSGIRAGSEIGARYDSLLAKVIALGRDREHARRRLIEALRETVLLGVGSNLVFLLELLESEFYVKAETYTTTLESSSWTEPPVPAAVAAYAARALAAHGPGGGGGGAGAGGAGGGPADRCSPWTALGPFRMGS
ncbi:MAG: ATP-grasp domain-containing protein [Planctomycetes bacterium]|nr:ATP-grasp domain-containing protein [Planctomycetota bacterium]